MLRDYSMGTPSQGIASSYSSIKCITRLMVLAMAIPQSLGQQYYYQNGYYYPYQYYQYGGDQFWQFPPPQQQQQFPPQPNFPQPQPMSTETPVFVQPERPQAPVQIFSQPPQPPPAPPPPPPQFTEERPQAAKPVQIMNNQPTQTPQVNEESFRENPMERVTPLPPKRAPNVDNRREFDLPPPPPSRFLPDDEDQKKISLLIAQQKQAARVRQGNRTRLPKGERRTTTTIEPTTTTTTTEPPTPVAPQVIESVINNPDKTISHLSPKKNDPNAVFLDCCYNKNVDKKCESRCNFETLNKKVLTQMFLGTDPCPQAHGIDLFACAAQDGDHTECCLSKKVNKTAAGNKCLAFCKLTPDAHFQVDPSYLPCWAVLNHVKNCFKEAIINN